jgi:hypothetical protein
MAVLHDYNCLAHGIFEGFEAVCPHGCKGTGFVSVVHLKAPGIGTQRTKNLDAITRNLANQFGLTDMDNRGGQPVKRPDPMAVKRAEEYQRWVQEKFGPTWQDVAPGGVMGPDKKVRQGEGGGNGAIETISSKGAQGGSAVARDDIGHVSVALEDGSAVTLANVSSRQKHDMLAQHVEVAKYEPNAAQVKAAENHANSEGR